MTSTILTPSVITKEAQVILHQKLNFVGNINTQYDAQYAKSGAKIGNNLQVRLPNEYEVRTGATLNVQDQAEEAVTMTVATQKGVDMYFTAEEMTMHIDEFSQRCIEPAVSVLAAAIEADALSMKKDVYNFYDGADAAFGFNSATEARKLLNQSLAPGSNRCMLHPTEGGKDFLQDTKGLFQDSTAIAKQYKEGMIGRVAGMDHFENTILDAEYTSGTAVEGDTGYNVNGASQTGSSITVNGGTTTFVKGDIITFAGCNRVHPETKEDTGVLMKFVVTADSGASATTLSIAPSITTSGGRQNVSSSPTTTGAVSKIGGGASADWYESLAFHRDAFAFATADLEMPQGVDFSAREVMDGISMRLVRNYDINNDRFPCRLDVLYGYKTIRPQLAARVSHN